MTGAATIGPAADGPVPSTTERLDEGVRAGWPRWAFRVTTLVATLLLAAQAVLAGQFLGGRYESLALHSTNSTLAFVAVAVATVAAVLLRRPGRGAVWPIAACIGLLTLVATQAMLGYTRVVALHVPLGVTIIVLSVALSLWAWRRA